MVDKMSVLTIVAVCVLDLALCIVRGKSTAFGKALTCPNNICISLEMPL